MQPHLLYVCETKVHLRNKMPDSPETANSKRDITTTIANGTREQSSSLEKMDLHKQILDPILSCDVS